MFSLNVFTRRAFLVLAASGPLAIASCGVDTDYGLGQMFPVSGTVTYNGKPLEMGQIVFTPENLKEGVGSTANIESGSYSLGTAGDKNGARPGKYKVSIVAKEDSEAQAKAEFEKAMAKRPEMVKNLATARIPREYMVKATKEAKSLIPAGYGDIRTTTLTAEVKEETNQIDFKLTDAEAPPEPPKSTGKGRGRK